MGVFAVGDRVVVRRETQRADGIHAGTRGTVVAYSIAARASNQVVHVQLKSKSKAVAMFAPCDLGPELPAAESGAPGYEVISREEFRARMQGRRVTVRMIAT